ncbi:MAG: LuxR C-terminal-related transcriptional regulator [Bryobacteraceae bacterium]
MAVRSAGPAVVPKSISICDTQPVTAEGVRNLLSGVADLHFLETADSLKQATDLVRRSEPDVLILDKAFGIQAILDWLGELRPGSGGASGPASDTAGALPAPPKTAFVIWGVSVTEAEALRFLQAGARGILRKTAGVQSVLACLHTVAQGRSWMEDCVFRDSSRSDRYPRSELTGREQQVLELVEQGFKNKEIANELGIRPGTVKIHLKHIFEKTGVRGRYGLALNGLKDRGMVALSA